MLQNKFYQIHLFLWAGFFLAKNYPVYPQSSQCKNFECNYWLITLLPFFSLMLLFLSFSYVLKRDSRVYRTQQPAFSPFPVKWLHILLGIQNSSKIYIHKNSCSIRKWPYQVEFSDKFSMTSL